MKLPVFIILCLIAAPVITKLIMDAMDDDSDWGFVKFILLIVAIAAVFIVVVSGYFK